MRKKIKGEWSHGKKLGYFVKVSIPRGVFRVNIFLDFAIICTFRGHRSIRMPSMILKLSLIIKPTCMHKAMGPIDAALVKAVIMPS